MYGFSRSSYEEHYMGGPLPFFLFVCFAFYTSVPFPFFVFTCWFLLFGVQTYPVDPYLEWLGVAGKAHGHGHGPVRRQIPYYCVGCFFPGPARYTQFAPFFGHLMKCRGGGRPRQWPSSVWAAVLKIDWAWAEATLSLTPQLLISKKPCKLSCVLPSLLTLLLS